MVGSGHVLGRRSLNRATLHRQHLLERQPWRAGVVAETIEHLVGMQAQNPLDPYYATWSRVTGFEASHLSDVLAAREAVEELPEARVKPLVTIEEMMDQLAKRVQSAMTISFKDFAVR